MATNRSDTLLSIAVETRDFDLAAKLATVIAEHNARPNTVITFTPPDPSNLDGKQALWSQIAALTRDRDNARREIKDLETIANRWRTEATETREQLRVADGDRVPLAMDVETMRADLIEARAKIEIMNALCSVAQQWEPVMRAWVPGGDDGYIGAANAKLGEACALYETSMAELADRDIPF